jgi:hypothetical protein
VSAEGCASCGNVAVGSYRLVAIESHLFHACERCWIRMSPLELLTASQMRQSASSDLTDDSPGPYDGVDDESRPPWNDMHLWGSLERCPSCDEHLMVSTDHVSDVHVETLDAWSGDTDGAQETIRGGILA